MEYYTQKRCAATADQGETSLTTPMIVITILFFMWGLLTSLNDVLIPHLKAIYALNYMQAMLVQFCFFGAYFIASVPAGILIKRIGYQRGVVTGLLLAAFGCALFYPAAKSGYGLFLMAFFTLACGITTLQVAANPYVTALGSAKTASSRLTLTQAFNSLGTTIGPALGGILILSQNAHGIGRIETLSASGQTMGPLQQAESVQGPYLILAAVLLVMAFMFSLARLPKIESSDADFSTETSAPLFSQLHLILGAIGIFVYVGAEVSIGSFLINFVGEPTIAGLTTVEAAHYVSYYWGGAMIGRFIGFAVMRTISPGIALAFNSGSAIMLILIAIFGHGELAMWTLITVGLANSIMFPAIFSMALHGLGTQTGRGSGLLCMAIVGGAIVPFMQGFFADFFGVQKSFFVPAVCYAYILFFGLRFSKLYTSHRTHRE